MKPLAKTRLFTPGPTPLLPEALLSPLANPMHHRKEDFKTLFREVQRGLQEFFKTRNDILLLASSGSGGLEAAMTNVLEPGERALVAVAGKFGERWLELAEIYQVDLQAIRAEYGESVSPEQIGECLAREPRTAAVFVQAMETSTGAVHDVAAIAALVKRLSGTVLIVDAITALGTTELQTDRWGLDIVVGASQKAFMVPPGAAMLSISDKAWARIERCRRPRYYFDLRTERRGQHDGGQSAYTPAISLIQGLKASLDYAAQHGGVDGLIANAALQAGATRAAVAAWGLRIFPRHPGSAVTAFEVPAGVEASRVIAEMRGRFGVHISGGQGSMKGRILRIGHLGYFDFLETLGMIGCLELALGEAGCSLRSGEGTRAALDFYRHAAGGR